MNTSTTVVNDTSHQVVSDSSIPGIGKDQCWIDPQGHREITIQDHHGQPVHVIAQVSSESVPCIETVYKIPVKDAVHSVVTDSMTSYHSLPTNVLLVTNANEHYTTSQLNLSQPMYMEVPVTSAPTTSNSSSSAQNQLAKKLFTCECGQSFKLKTGLKSHMKVHTGVKPFQCNICNKRFAHKQNKEFHMLRHTGERPYKCDKCDRTFICVALLNRHKRGHEGNYAFRCNICDQGFILKRNYVEHMNVHTNTRPFQCNICCKSFSRREALRVHKKIHTGETPFVCKECGKAFPLRTRLEIHMRRHTGETPYMCLDCGQVFYTSPQLNDHQRRYHGTCQDIRFKCQECGVVFKKQCGLSAHMRIHQGGLKNSLSCEQCKREFSSQRVLTSHARHHDSSLPYHCNVCLLFFATQNSYTRHRCTPATPSSQQKTGDNPGIKKRNSKKTGNPVKQKYGCDSCGKSFMSSHNLKRHLKIHNKETQKTKTIVEEEEQKT